ncbi:3149_t:CDS:1, partial [Cetraspora pellucida]
LRTTRDANNLIYHSDDISDDVSDDVSGDVSGDVNKILAKLY